MLIKKRPQFVTSFLRIIFRTFLRIKYKAVIEKPISIEDGSLVICNHTTSMD